MKNLRKQIFDLYTTQFNETIRAVEDDNVRRADFGDDRLESSFDAVRFGKINGERIEPFWHVIAFRVTRSDSDFVDLLDKGVCYGIAHIRSSAEDDSYKLRRHI